MTAPDLASLHGFLNLDKPPGLTSRDAVDLVVRALRKVGRPPKVGHAGTLDPLAMGVLVVAVGAATRLIERVQAQPKVYRTVIRLGASSDTLDADGQIVETVDPDIPDETEVGAAIRRQVGLIDQVPPQYSALKVGGRRAYDLARGGEAVELAARPVRIDRVDLISYAWPRLELEVACGAGTYIRSIARDVGEALGCGGLVEVLVRTRIGPFSLEDALDPRALDALTIASGLRPMTDALGAMPALTLSPEELVAIGQGRAIRLEDPSVATGEVALLAPEGWLAALGERDVATGLVCPHRVFPRG